MSKDPPYKGYADHTPDECIAFIDEIVLTLTNERKFYDDFIALRDQYNPSNYGTVRKLVFDGIVDFFDQTYNKCSNNLMLSRGFDAFKVRHITTGVTHAVLEHYAEEVLGYGYSKSILRHMIVGVNVEPYVKKDMEFLYGPMAPVKEPPVVEEAKLGKSVFSLDVEAYAIPPDYKDRYRQDLLDSISRQAFMWPDPVAVTTFQPKEKQMDIKQNVTLVDGVDASKITDDGIFGMINSLESQIEVLSKTKNKPQKLKDKIKGLNDQIKVLITIVDSRD